MRAKKSFSIKSNSIVIPVTTLEAEGSRLKASNGECCFSIFDLTDVRHIQMFGAPANGFACLKIDGFEINGAYLLDDLKAFVSNIE